MVRYGARLATEDQKALPEILSAQWRGLREHPERLAQPPEWDAALASTTITEWPIGDAMSQAHDQLLARNGRVYVADNIQDRLYEIDPVAHRVTVHKIPHREGEAAGGMLAARLKDFPRHDSTSNAHSLAESPRDGHIFITPSAQRRLVEFAPETGEFTLHEMDGGFYPHTIRIDAKDRVWFTLALSNQVAMFDRQARRFTLYDLPTRGLREWLTVALIRPTYALNVDKRRGIVWVTGNQSDALYAFDIAAQAWRHVPLPRRVAFTRDIEIAQDGTVYTSTSSFPSWHVEDRQPTMIRVQTGGTQR